MSDMSGFLECIKSAFSKVSSEDFREGSSRVFGEEEPNSTDHEVFALTQWYKKKLEETVDKYTAIARELMESHPTISKAGVPSSVGDSNSFDEVLVKEIGIRQSREKAVQELNDEYEERFEALLDGEDTPSLDADLSL